MLYVESTMSPEQVNTETGAPIAPVHARTGLYYAKILSSVVHKMGTSIFHPTFALFCAGLRRRGNILEVDQAPPISSEEIHQLIPTLPASERHQLLLLWKTAARHSDFRHVRSQHLNFVRTSPHPRPTQPHQEMHVWSLRTLTHKGDPFGEGTGIEIGMTLEQHELLQTFKRTALPGDMVVTISYDRLLQILRESNPEFSEHSIKRGALLAMMLTGTPLETLRVVAKHKTVAQLLRYLPTSAAVGNFYRTSNATIMI
jgi:hypothetical protein